MIWIGLGGLIAILVGIGLVWFSGRRTVSEERRREAAKLKKLMDELQESPGWRELQRIAKEQVSARSNQVLLVPTESPLTQEYLKGEIQGLRLIVELPEKLAADAAEVLAVYQREQDRA